MPLNPLDIGLLVIMLISGILAMVRGFMREVLSIASWAAAAVVTIIATPKLMPTAREYITNEYLAYGVVIAGVFLGMLLIVSVITIKISDSILDSRIGALDRTLGFLFGLGRGLIIMVVTYMFFDWLVPEKSQPTWVKEARSQAILKGTGEWMRSMSPDLEALWAKYRPAKPDDAAPDAPPQGEPPRPERGAGSTQNRSGADEQIGYDRTDRTGMQQLLNAPPPKTR